MMNNAPPNTIPTKPFIRHIERRLVGLAMMIIAYLLEKAVLRTIRRDGKKSSSQDRTAS